MNQILLAITVFLGAFWRELTGAKYILGHAEAGVITLIGVTAPTQRGIASAEAGVNASKFSLEIEPEINDWLPGITGEAIGKAVGSPMGRLTIEGEITAATGIMAALTTTVFVPTNTVNYFGRTAGGFYLSRATVDQDRDGWKRLSAEFESRFGVA